VVLLEIEVVTGDTVDVVGIEVVTRTVVLVDELLLTVDVVVAGGAEVVVVTGSADVVVVGRTEVVVTGSADVVVVVCAAVLYKIIPLFGSNVTLLTMLPVRVRSCAPRLTVELLSPGFTNTKTFSYSRSYMLFTLR
jgi:hypothetical protein